jgi:two-component system, NarL family, invasion response regulator UvrY
MTALESGHTPAAMECREQRTTCIDVLTVDDQAVFREVARAVIEATAGFRLVGEAGTGEDALEAVRRLGPALVLLDVRMPGIGGIEAARRIRAEHPDVVVVLTSADSTGEMPPEEASSAATFVRKQDLRPGLLQDLWRAYGEGC